MAWEDPPAVLLCATVRCCIKFSVRLPRHDIHDPSCGDTLPLSKSVIFKVALMACKSKRRRGNLAGVLERGGRVDAQLPTKRYFDLRDPTANYQVLQVIDAMSSGFVLRFGPKLRPKAPPTPSRSF